MAPYEVPVSGGRARISWHLVLEQQPLGDIVLVLRPEDLCCNDCAEKHDQADDEGAIALAADLAPGSGTPQGCRQFGTRSDEGEDPITC